MQQCFSLERPDYWSPVWHFVILLDKICCSTLSIFILRKPDKRTGVGLGWLISLSGWSGDGRSSVWWRARCCKSGSCAMGISADKKTHHSWFPPLQMLLKYLKMHGPKQKLSVPHITGELELKTPPVYNLAACWMLKPGVLHFLVTMCCFLQHS